METTPKLDTLQEAIVHFSDPENCRQYVIARRWPDGVTCPRCGNKNVTWQPKHNRWQCSSHHPLRTFTTKTGTIFEESPLGLDKWLAAMWQVVNCKNGVSSYEVHRAIGVTQKTAWFMDHRIRLALRMGSLEKAKGEVELDETFIGGKARFMHAAQRQRRITGTGGKDKAAVMGILERGGKVRTVVVGDRRKKTLQAEVHEHVEAGSALYSDALLSYEGLEGRYAHQVIDHAVAYVNGKVHTNGLENFWSLLKRSIHGTYVSVEPYHLARYLDEQSFRVQLPQGHERRREVRSGREAYHRKAAHVQGTHRQDRSQSGAVLICASGEENVAGNPVKEDQKISLDLWIRVRYALTHGKR